MIKTLISLPYEAVRLPLTVVDRGLSRRLSESSLPRLTVGRTLGTADKVAGTLLRNRDLTARGVGRIEHVDTLIAATLLEAEAAVKRQAAEDVAEAGRRDAAAKREAANERATAAFSEADEAEKEGKQQAAAKAKKAAAAKKAEADGAAAEKAEMVARRKKAVAEKAEAKKKAARDEAKADLADARESKEAAAEARTDAEVLSDLAEAKKAERKQD